MNLNQLLYFSVTARHQHFTRAAEELFISQPSLSYAISSLEDELGVSLFQKKGRNVVLTKHGEIFLKHVERALSEIQQGRDAISRLITETENRIELATSGTFIGRNSIPHLLREFMCDPQNAGVSIGFHQVSEIELLPGLQSMKYDIIITSDVCDDPDLTFTPLYTHPLVAVVSNNHPLANIPSVTIDDLQQKQYPLLLRDGSTSAKHILQQLHDPNIACHVQDRLALLSLAAENFGVAITVETNEINSFPVKSIPIATPGCSYTLYMACKTNRYLTPALERFITHLHSHAEN